MGSTLFIKGVMRCCAVSVFFLGSIASVRAHGISCQVVLIPVLAGDTPIVRPEPVKNEESIVSTGDNIAIYRKRFVAYHTQHYSSDLDRRQSIARHAVLWRMRSLAIALRFVIRNE